MAFLVRIVLIALLCAIVSSSTVAQTQLKIKLGVIPSDFAGEAYYAQELGFFKAAGLDVEITSLTNGAAIAAAVASGAVDIGYASVIPLITGHDHGLPFTIVSPDDLAISKAPTGGILAVLKGSPVRSARDLEGKTVGIDGLNNLAWLAVRNWIDTNGGRSDLVRFVELPWWQMPAALQAHTVDAASTNQVSDPDIGKPDDSLRLLANVFGSIAPRFASGAWISTNDWVAKHPDAAKTFTAVMRRTAAWANIHHHETAAILAKYLNQTPAQIERATRVTYTTEIDPTLLQPAIDVAVKYHVIRAPFPARDLISSIKRRQPSMAKPKIRHIAMFARDPEKVAKFYQEVFEMELIDSYHNGGGQAQFVSDGYLTIAILPHRLDGSATCGLNHFGFQVDDATEIRKRITDRGLVAPMKRPADRIYAEYRGVDPENNWFDISENGYDQRRPEADEIKKQELTVTR